MSTLDLDEKILALENETDPEMEWGVGLLEEGASTYCMWGI